MQNEKIEVQQRTWNIDLIFLSLFYKCSKLLHVLHLNAREHLFHVSTDKSLKKEVPCQPRVYYFLRN